MKKRFFSFSIILALSLISLCSFAQQTKHHDHIHLPKELKLTEEQKNKLELLYEAFREKIIRIQVDTLLSKDELKSKIKRAGEEHKAGMKAILTHEQYEKLKDVMRKSPVTCKEEV